MNHFDFALDYIFANEGGFANQKNDRGGATKYGITIGTLSRWRHSPASVKDVKNLTQTEAKAIYRSWYWNSMDLDKILDRAISTSMFDIGIVRGVAVPPKYAQRICIKMGYSMPVDGHIGPKTIAGLNSLLAPRFVDEFASMAEQGFRSIVAGNASQGRFLRGWVNRARRLRTLVR
jgi:type VI secretion system secreted protein VgrG